ncbi:MAG TPA: hypothetical protein VLX59_03345, partial [Acidimicrobiales bacterium]|nr:hypothetical protein [Acidimicrobiales bacterium]
MQVAEAAAGLCDLIWLVDTSVPEMKQMLDLLNRFGPVVAVDGMTVEEMAEALSPERPDAMVTLLDAGMVDYARLAQALGLEFHSPAVAEALIDKAR